MGNSPFDLYQKVRESLTESGDLIYFFIHFFKELDRRPVERREFLRQFYLTGNRSPVLMAVIGFTIGPVGCCKGYYCENGTAGAGLAAKLAVVTTSLLLFVIDFIAVFITYIFLADECKKGYTKKRVLKNRW